MATTTVDTKERAPGFSAARIISSGKDLISLLRDAFLFILIIMLLFLPEQLNKTLVRAGFKEGSIAGFKWEAGIAQYDATLKESQATITELKAQLDSTSKILAEAQTKTSDPELKEKLEKVEEENKVVKASTSQTQENARRTILTNVELVKIAKGSVNFRTLRTQ
jgi:16S rRNA G1207 methylase RsmC